MAPQRCAGRAASVLFAAVVGAIAGGVADGGVLARPVAGGCRISHVFSPYHVSGVEAEQVKLTYSSWLAAAEHARARGHKIEFLSACLPADADAAPAWSRVVPLGHWVTDDRNRTIPTVGGIMAAAKRAGNGSYVLLTNLDIGVAENFYTRGCAKVLDASADDRGPRVWEFTRLQLKMSAEGATLADVVANVRRGRRHPGHDAFLYPRELDLGCFLDDPGLILAYPPWGVLLKIALRGATARNGGAYEVLRSTPKGMLHTFHVTDVDEGRWQESYESSLATHAFLYAQVFRMLAGKTRVGRWDMRAGHPEGLLEAACVRRAGGTADKPAPLCELCSGLFPKERAIKDPTGAKAPQIFRYLTSTVQRARLMVPTEDGDGSDGSTGLAIGGLYRCAGQMPECDHLEAGACTGRWSRPCELGGG